MQVDSSALMQATKANAGESGLDVVNKANQVHAAMILSVLHYPCYCMQQEALLC